MKKQVTLDDGDGVERENAAWLRSRLPEYETLWKRFIGNDGSNRHLHIANLGSITEAKREAFTQAHYSLMRAVLDLRDIAEGFSNHKAGRLTITDERRVHREWTCFMAYLGRLRDMAEKMDNALGTGERIWRRFDDFYSQRNNVLHSPISAQQIDCNYLQVAVPAKRTPIAKTWTQASRWSDACEMTFVELDRFVIESTNEAIGLVRASISDALSRIEELVGTKLEPLWIETQGIGGETSVTAQSSSTCGTPTSGTCRVEN